MKKALVLLFIFTVIMINIVNAQVDTTLKTKVISNEVVVTTDSIKVGDTTFTITKRVTTTISRIDQESNRDYKSFFKYAGAIISGTGLAIAGDLMAAQGPENRNSFYTGRLLSSSVNTALIALPVHYGYGGSNDNLDWIKIPILFITVSALNSYGQGLLYKGKYLGGFSSTMGERALLALSPLVIDFSDWRLAPAYLSISFFSYRNFYNLGCGEEIINIDNSPMSHPTGKFNGFMGLTGGVLFSLTIPFDY